MKLHVNLPRFNRDREVKLDSRLERVSRGGKREWPASNRVNIGRSYADVVAKEGVRKKPSPEVENNVAENYFKCYGVDVNNLDRTKKCYVGRVKDPLHPFAVQEKIFEAGYFHIKAMPMGGDMVLIDSENLDSTMEFLEGAKDIWESFFSSIDPWSPNIVVRERYTWIKCFGIPVHVWEECFFKFILMGKGTLIDIDESTKSKRRLDLARVLVKTGMNDWCNCNVMVKIGEMVHNIRLVEEIFGNQDPMGTPEYREIPKPL